MLPFLLLGIPYASMWASLGQASLLKDGRPWGEKIPSIIAIPVEVLDHPDPIHSAGIQKMPRQPTITWEIFTVLAA